MFLTILILPLFLQFTLSHLTLQTRTISSGTFPDRRDLVKPTTLPRLYAFKFSPTLSSSEKRLFRETFSLDFRHQIDRDGFVKELTSREVIELLPHLECLDFYNEDDKTLLDIQKDDKEVHEAIGNGQYKLVISTHNDENDVSNFPRLKDEVKVKKLSFVRSDIFVTTTDRDFAIELINDMKKRNDVVWIYREREMEVKNYGANEILQGVAVSMDFKLWDVGVTGEDQVVTVMDTGLEISNCFFYDDTESVGETLNMNHRKVVYYENMVESLANPCTTNNHCDFDGHGTHVSGSVAGNILGTETYFTGMEFANGVAKDAKLIMQQVGDNEGYLSGIPDDMYNEAFGAARNLGSYIHTNSWGCGMPFDCSYDCLCAYNDTIWDGDKCIQEFGVRCCEICNYYSSTSSQIDTFLHDNLDNVILFAAGNDGFISEDATIGAPSTAKSAITVGSSRTTVSNWQKYAEINANYHAQQYLSLDNNTQCCDDNAIKEWFNITDQSIVDLAKSYCCIPFMQNVYSSDEYYYSRYTLSDFSSRGETLDGRTGIDVVGPGDKVLSAYSTMDTDDLVKYCDYDDGGDHTYGSYQQTDLAIIGMQGTSMATPAMAGYTALLRQYFMDGYYPSGVQTGADEFTPSGMLLKATIIQAADVNAVNHVKLGDGNFTFFNNSFTNKINNYYVGYGLPQLANILPLDGAIEKFDDLKFNDKYWTNDGSVVDNFCFEPNSAENALVATMVYYDHPAAMYAVSVTMNDLDLVAQVYDSGDVVIQTVYGNGDGSVRDMVNTVEKLMVKDIAVGNKVCVVVEGTSVNYEPQYYSLIVSSTNHNITTYQQEPLSGGNMLRSSILVLSLITFVFF